MSSNTTDITFPCTLTLNIPFPTHRLVSFALRALQVDVELSPLVQRSFRLVSAEEQASPPLPATNGTTGASLKGADNGGPITEEKTILCVAYKATTNRMLRVAVNGFMESLGVVVGVMEELDVDVLDGDIL